MAAQKKTTAKRAAPKQSAAARTRSSGGTRRAPARKQPKKQPIRREVGGGICILLALFVTISYFQHEALFIKCAYAFFRGTTGWGWYAALPALLLCAWIRLLHRGRPVTSHVVGALLIPVLLGALVHISFDVAPVESGLGALKALWAGGVALESGGVLSGGLAIGFKAVIGKVGTMVVFVLGLVACLMLALRLTPAGVIDSVKNHEFVPYDVPDEPEPKRETAPARPAREKKPKPVIDIPVDDPIEQPKPKNAPLFAAAKDSFFVKKADHIRTPDQLLTDAQDKPAEANAAAATPAPATPAEPPKLDPIAPPAPPEPEVSTSSPTKICAPSAR